MTSSGDDFAILDRIRFDAATRQLFELIPGVYFFIKDVAGRLIYCNEAHRRGIFRYANPDEFYGKQNVDFFPNALAVAFEQDDESVIQTGQPILERCELNITASGSLSWFCTTKIPARDVRGKIIGLIGISRRLEAADSRLEDFALLSPAIAYIQQHYTGTIQAPALARVCRTSEATFRRQFLRLFRMTPLRFILRLRLHEACLRLCNGTTPIGVIAVQSGFPDQNYFARHFKRTMGITPTEFRARHVLSVKKVFSATAP